MTDFIHSISLGAIQGITEFLPISSTGHLVIFRDILGINVEYGLAFDAILQLATVLSVLVFFRKDIFGLLKASVDKTKTEDRKLIKCLIVGTIPAVILGLLFQDVIESFFRNIVAVSVALIVGAIIMFVSEKFLTEKNLTTKNSFVIGLFQSLALIPGMSRAGMTIAGGYFLGLKKDVAIRFSFLLSIPIIGGSGMYKLLEIVGDKELFLNIWPQLLVGSVSAFIFGIISIGFLIKFLKTHTFKGFVVYRIILAVFLLGISLF